MASTKAEGTGSSTSSSTGNSTTATITPAVNPALRKERGTVKMVLSGDTLVVLDDKPNPNGPPTEKIITLSSLQAPKLARNKSEKDEEFAFESREFLRKKCVGKKVQYTVDHSAGGGREYVTVYLAPSSPGGEPECLNHTVLSEGWAALKETARRNEATVAMTDTAQTEHKGKFSTQKPVPIGKNDEDEDTLFRQLKGKQLSAIVEKVRTGTSLTVTLLPTRHTFQVLLSGAQAKGWKKSEDGGEPKPEKHAREAKFFVENNVLQREVNLTIEGVAPPGPGQDKSLLVFCGSIEFENHDVAEELLKAGLATYAAYSAAARGSEWVAKLKAAEKVAKDNKRCIYSNYEAKADSNSDKSIGKEFVARVVNIKNTNTIIVVPEGNKTEVTLTLSSINPPRPPFEGKKDNKKNQNQTEGKKEEEKSRLQEIADSHWAAEGKEMLRKRLIGAKVPIRAVHEYTKPPYTPPGGEPFPERSFYSVYQGEQNISALIVEAGFAKVNAYGPAEERSADFELLLMAEAKAKSSHKGVHMPLDKVPARRYHDLTTDSEPAERAKKAQPFLSTLERGGQLRAVIEHVFSGARFKVTIAKQNVVCFFALSGIRVPRPGETNDSDPNISDNALKASREKLQQLEVSIDVNGADKGGNFTGSLYFNKKNYAIYLLENGFAYIHYPSAERLKDFQELSDAEKTAKQNRVGVWKNYDEAAEKAKQEAAAAEAGEFVAGPGKSVAHDVIVTEVLDGARFYVQIVGAESAGLEELVNQLTELSVSEGTGMPSLQPKAGKLVRGQFTADDRWYRAKILEVLPGEKFKVQYVDYGNSEVIPGTRLRQLPPQAETLPEQAKLANLAFIKPLKEDNDNADDAKDFLRELAEGKKLTGLMEYKEAGALFLTLMDGSMNIALEMVREGLARIVRRGRRFQDNANFIALREAEQEAKKRHKNIWYYGEVADSDEDERDNVPKKGAKPTGPAAAAEKGGKKK